MAGQADKGGADESKRILDRIARESDAGGTSFVARAARGARDHVTAADADRSDPIEYWGTRIGRVLGLVIIVAMAAWLAVYIVNGG